MLAAGLLWLAAGLALYGAARPGTIAALLQQTGPRRPVLPHSLLYVLGPVPTLIHVVAFSLLTAAVFDRSRSALRACGAWVAINLILEAAQQPIARAWLIAAAGPAFPPVVRRFLAGTFDPADLAAALLGGAIAARFITHTWSRPMRTVRETLKGVVLAGVSMAGLAAIVASGGGGGTNPPPPPPTTGSIVVSLGFGAVTSPPYQCTGSGSIEATPVSVSGTAGTGTTTSKPYAFSGSSSTTPNAPACQTTVIFPDMRPGSWRVGDATVSCPATVIAGQAANVKITNGVCF